MTVKKLKRVCDVKGCSNKETYSISKSHGTGMTVIVCEDCLREALAEIEKLKAPAEEKYICDKCAKEFKSLSGLNAHIKKAHPEEV